MRIALWLHLLGVVVWVGGMLFAQMALRPAAQSLEPPQRLPMLAIALRRFFAWVALAVAAILATGFWMTALLGGFGRVATHVHVMTAVGLGMAVIFAWIVAVPFRALIVNAAEGKWPAAGAAMASIRTLVGINLVLGLVTLTVAVLGQGA